MIYHVVAMANNRVIGKDNKLPWHFPADLKRFKSITTGYTIIMGRKTFESIGKPLPNRRNLVLTRSGRKGEPGGAEFFPSFEEAVKAVSENEKIFVIGGAELFAQTLDKIDGIYMTRINADYEGDTAYPEIPGYFYPEWRETIQESPFIELIYYERLGEGK